MSYLCTCTWEQVPHLGEKEKAELLADYPPHQRDARTKGTPMLGAGESSTIKGMPMPAREQQLLELLVKALPNKVIAYEMGLRVGTVRCYLSAMYVKYHANNRTHLAILYKDGMLPRNPPAAGM